MLLNRHKNAVLVIWTVVGVALTIAMIIIGTQFSFFGNGTITSNRFSSYGLINAKAVTNPASDGLKSENISVEFEEPKNGVKSIKDNGFVSLGYVLSDANKEEPSIFNVHGISKWKTGNVEFLFESLSPKDYESKVFYQAFTPFTRLANSAGFENVKYLSKVGADGSRHVAIETTAAGDTLGSKEASDLWGQMLLVLSPMAENTSYDLTLTLEQGITVHGTLSSESEQAKMMEYDANNNWEGAFALANFAGVTSADLYLQGNDIRDNTVALTVKKPASVPNYVKSLKDYSANKENKFPKDFTTTITVENENTPVHVFSPGR